MTPFNIDAAVKHLIEHSHPKTLHMCAKYVADALYAGNLRFNAQPSAYLYHTNKILLNLGFKLIPRPNPPKKGDVYVQNKTKSHIHGHIAMFSGQQWISDFRQNSDQVYSSDPGEIYYYRYEKKNNNEEDNKNNGVIYENNNNSDKKSINEIANEVIKGLWGDGNERKLKLENQGYNYNEVQNEVNRIFGVGQNNINNNYSDKKSINEIANEVINGLWGNGNERKLKLENQGYNYNEVQNEVNRISGVGNNNINNNYSDKKSINEIAKEVMKGLWGNGNERKLRLENQGYNYKEVQNEVNKLCGY